MAGAAKQSKSQEIADKIEYLAESLKQGDELNLFQWRQLLREVEKLENVPEGYAFSLLNRAVLWSFRDDLDEVRRFFNIYAGTIGMDWDWHIISANMAPRLGSVECIQRLLDYPFPKNDPNRWVEVSEVCGQAGFFKSAAEALDQVWQLDEALAERVSSRLNYLRPAAEYIICNSLDEVDVARRVVFASRVLLDAGHRLVSFAVTANEFGITVEFSVRAEVEDVVDLDFLLLEKLVAAFDDPLSEHISVGFMPWEDE